MRKHPRFAMFVALPCAALGIVSPIIVRESGASGATTAVHTRHHHKVLTAAERRRVLRHQRALAKVRAAKPVRLVAFVDPAEHAPASAAPAGGVWAQLRLCESGSNYHANTGNGYYGAYQFSLSTWEAVGGTGLPSAAPAGLQDAAAKRLEARAGWWSWPHCAYSLGLV